MSNTLPFSEVKAHLSALAERVERDHDRIVVTRQGRSAFVLINPDDLEALEETVEILRDEERMGSLRRFRREAADGKAVELTLG
ncbi:MAG: type II toxin-antitoxin system Phd/YefM family antitoxin [Actinomycetota bacterium]|nr:type II toxin-antitoxin system Phd/YefM family antitoxin [Actinomycetota bacterium]